MMICSRRNENNSLFNVIIVMSRTQMSLYWRQLGPVKQRRFWATNVNRKWTLCILEQLLWLNIQGNRLYKSKDTSSCSPGLFAWKREGGGGGGAFEGKRTWGKGWCTKRKTALPAPFPWLRFVTSHSRFTLVSMRNRTCLRRKQGRQDMDSFELSCQVDCSLRGSLAPRISFPSPFKLLPHRLSRLKAENLF